MRSVLLILAGALALGSAEMNPVLHVWRINPRAGGATSQNLLAVLPDVHRVHADGQYVYVESAGLALQSLGPLEANGIEPPAGARNFVFRFPLAPRPAGLPATATPIGVTGAFVNGVPFYNPTSGVSWRDQNLWHLDAVAASQGATPLLSALLETNQKHSPLIGFAFDGYPVYGPYGWDAEGRIRRFRSSYRLRSITKRTVLPDGTELGPSQEGPPVDAKFPAGTFVEDYEYAAGSGDLDEHNGRWARTPEYPEGTYAYFLSTDTGNRLMYPYLVGSTYFGALSTAELSNAAHAGRHMADDGSTITYQPLDPEDARYISFAAAKDIQAGQPQNLVFSIRDAHGRRIRFVEKMHEQPIHLVVVSKDMKEFAHIHPELEPDDRFAVTYSFPRGGQYWLFADFARPGAAPSVARFCLDVAGAPSVDGGSSDDGQLTKIREGLRVTLALPADMVTGKDLRFRFQLADAGRGDPISDLQPYLGAWGHIMIVREDGKRFIHAHAADEAYPGSDSDPWKHTHIAPGPSPSSVSTVTGFREPGLYRMWVQFQRNGELVTVPYAFAVSEGHRAISHQIEVKDSIHVQVSSAGFEPARITVPAGKAVQIAFERKDAENCASAVVFPELNIRKDLPAGSTTLVEVPASGPRELSFSCGMKMFRGAVVVR